MQNLQLPSFFFLTKTTGEGNELLFGCMRPFFNIFCIIFSIWFLWMCGYLYSLTFTGSTPWTKLIAWFWSLFGGNPVGVSKTFLYVCSNWVNLGSTSLGIPYNWSLRFSVGWHCNREDCSVELVFCNLLKWWNSTCIM